MIALADLVTQLRQIELKATNSGHRAVAGQAADRLARIEALMKTASTFADEADCVVCGSTKDTGGERKFSHADDCWLRDLLQLRGTGEPG